MVEVEMGIDDAQLSEMEKEVCASWWCVLTPNKIRRKQVGLDWIDEVEEIKIYNKLLVQTNTLIEGDLIIIELPGNLGDKSFSYLSQEVGSFLIPNKKI